MKTFVVSLMIWGAFFAAAPQLHAAEPKSIRVKSSIDNTLQPSLYWSPETTEAVPLLVCLHSWSGDYRQSSPRNDFLKACQKRGWAFLHPNFRGPNNRPEACGSDLAVRDVEDAVFFVLSERRIDYRRIYVTGASGGGHMTLLMATRVPRLWAGASAWVPITDLAAWHRTHTRNGKAGKYATMVEKCCGGAPGNTPWFDREYRLRSPLFHMAKAKGLPIDINAGIHDGHKGSVPIDHSLNAFNIVAIANGHKDRVISDAHIALLRDRRKVPHPLAPSIDPKAGRRFPILFRQDAGPARVTIFEGGHQHDTEAAMNWLAKQQRTETSYIFGRTLFE